jgi:hypothetical protein
MFSCGGQLRYKLFLMSSLTVLGTNASCSVIVDSNRQQCSSDTDCTKRGEAFANSVCVESTCRAVTPWSCLGSVVWPPVGTGYINATLNLKNIVTYAPIVGVNARVCRKLDVSCEQPIFDGLQSDELGKLLVQAPSGFDGYVELKGSNAIPGSYFFYPPLTETREVPFVPILPLSDFTGFAQLVGSQILPERGHLVLGAYDCSHKFTEGVSIFSPEADASSSTFYLIKGIPNSKAEATDSSGYGGILNLRPGSVTLSGRLITGEIIGTESLLIRGGEITYTSLLPLPE